MGTDDRRRCLWKSLDPPLWMHTLYSLLVNADHGVTVSYHSHPLARTPQALGLGPDCATCMVCEALGGCVSTSSPS